MKWMFPLIFGGACLALAFYLAAPDQDSAEDSPTTSAAVVSQAIETTPGVVAPLPAGPPSVSDQPRGSSLSFTSVSGVSLVFVCGAVVVVGKLLKPRRVHRLRRSPSTATASSAPSVAPVLQSVEGDARLHTVQELGRDDFALLVGEIHRRQGYQAELSAGAGAGAGIDLILHRGEERVLVQCKAWNAAKVGARDLREFHGVLVSEGATRGVFVTTGEFTRDAWAFTDGKPITMVDGDAFFRLLVATETELGGGELLDVRQWAPAFLATAKLTQPECPFCAAPMTKRTGQVGSFWGCETYPRCCGRRNLRPHSEENLVSEIGEPVSTFRASAA